MFYFAFKVVMETGKKVITIMRLTVNHNTLCKDDISLCPITNEFLDNVFYGDIKNKELRK